MALTLHLQGLASVTYEGDAWPTWLLYTSCCIFYSIISFGCTRTCKDKQGSVSRITESRFSLRVAGPYPSHRVEGRIRPGQEETHAGTGRTYKLHSERTLAARPGNRTQAFLAVRRQRNPPCHP
ncbi:hypothetical protein AOLI_G00191850 [Acnodon oligacanthus]